MQGEGTVAEVLAGEARFAVVCGDAVEVLRAVPKWLLARRMR